MFKEDQTLDVIPFAKLHKSFIFSLIYFVLLLMIGTVPGCSCPVALRPYLILRCIGLDSLNPLKAGSALTDWEKWRNLKDLLCPWQPESLRKETAPQGIS